MDDVRRQLDAERKKNERLQSDSLSGNGAGSRVQLRPVAGCGGDGDDASLSGPDEDEVKICFFFNVKLLYSNETCVFLDHRDRHFKAGKLFVRLPRPVPLDGRHRRQSPWAKLLPAAWPSHQPSTGRPEPGRRERGADADNAGAGADAQVLRGGTEPGGGAGGAARGDRPGEPDPPEQDSANQHHGGDEVRARGAVDPGGSQVGEDCSPHFLLVFVDGHMFFVGASTNRNSH